MKCIYSLTFVIIEQRYFKRLNILKKLLKFNYFCKVSYQRKGNIKKFNLIIQMECTKFVFKFERVFFAINRY